jgi:hypothetical protein
MIEPRLRTREIGQRVAVANPFMAAAVSHMFAGQKMHKGPPRPAPRYHPIKGEVFDGLDQQNRDHVTAVLKVEAKKRGCLASDLGWALGPKPAPSGLYPVMVKEWEDIERQAFEAKKAK